MNDLGSIGLLSGAGEALSRPVILLVFGVAILGINA